jgi:hypothetical protein
VGGSEPSLYTFSCVSLHKVLTYRHSLCSSSVTWR